MANIGFCEWENVPSYADKKVRSLLQFIFPNEDLDRSSDLISHFIVAGSVLNKPHFEHPHYKQQFDDGALVQCELGIKYQMGIEFGLRFEQFGWLMQGDKVAFSITGGFSQSAFSLSQKIFELWGIEMAKWQEVWDKNDISQAI